MGDRCYVEINVRKCDEEAYNALDYYYEFEDQDFPGDHVKLVDEERNYGVSDNADDLAPGCPMFGYHSEGGDYLPHMFAYDGKTFMQHECNQYGKLVVECGFDGPDPDDVNEAKEFLAFYRSVEKMVVGTESTANAE